MHSSLMKIVVYEVSVVRNLQYDIDRIAKKLESFEMTADIQAYRRSIPQQVLFFHEGL